MSSTRALPFLKSPKQEIVAIGNDEIGIIHLLKKGGVSPNEKPPELEESQKRAAEIQWLMIDAARRIAQKEGISSKEARKRIFGGATVDETTDVLDKEENDGLAIYDYLTKEEAQMLLNQRDIASEIAIATTTLLIQHRVARPVRVSTTAKSGAKKIEIDPLGFPIPAHSELKFGHVKVSVTEAQEVGSEAIATDALPHNLPAGKIGYLVDPDTGKELLGDPEWTKDDTRAVITEELIRAIHEFYELESQGIRELPEDESDEKKLKSSSTSSLPTSTENPQIGQESTGESNPSESQMNGSAPKTLATSLSG